MRLNPAQPSQSKVDISLSINFVTTTANKLTEELKGDQRLNAAKFTVAIFLSTKIVSIGEDTANFTCDFTLHGVTKPLSLNAHLIGINPMTKAETVGFEASATIKRSDFDMKTYFPLVGDDVRLIIADAFEMQ